MDVRSRTVSPRTDMQRVTPLVALVAALSACASPPPPADAPLDVADGSAAESSPPFDATSADRVDVAECPDGGLLCDGACVNPARAIDHCGACGRSCVVPGAENFMCASGSCSFTCVGTNRDCDGDPTNGCEVDVATSPRHCGRCGTACDGGGCSAGMCR